MAGKQQWNKRLIVTALVVAVAVLILVIGAVAIAAGTTPDRGELIPDESVVPVMPTVIPD